MLLRTPSCTKTATGLELPVFVLGFEFRWASHESLQIKDPLISAMRDLRSATPGFGRVSGALVRRWINVKSAAGYFSCTLFPSRNENAISILVVFTIRSLDTWFFRMSTDVGYRFERKDARVLCACSNSSTVESVHLWTARDLQHRILKLHWSLMIELSESEDI